MSAQLEALSKALRDLPYLDTMKVADIVFTQLKGKPLDQHAVAEALSAVRPLMGDLSAEVAAEERALRKALRRKRQIIIEPQPKGWKVSIPGSHATALSPELRHAVNTVLDQYVMLVALEAEK